MRNSDLRDLGDIQDARILEDDLTDLRYPNRRWAEPHR
jgi:hypothetical protein